MLFSRTDKAEMNMVMPILLYHHITEDSAPANLGRQAVPVSQFKREMRYLYDHHYRCLPLNDILNDTPIQWNKTFVLTFDDGYEDFLTRAYPVLHAFGFTATVFLTTDEIKEGTERKRDAHDSRLTWGEIKGLCRRGISFGSHTCSHPHLPQLPSEDIWHELTASKACLETQLAQQVDLLAYPYGESSQTIQQMARAAGYHAALGVITGRHGRYNLWRRPCLKGESVLTFRFKLSRWFYYFTALRRWLREATFAGRVMRTIKRSWPPQPVRKERVRYERG
jgi:peptidoglycan/xylan/chitin deacetylase (PgdA/CDA1 family)